MKKIIVLAFVFTLVVLGGSVFGYEYVKCTDAEKASSPTEGYYCVVRGDMLSKILYNYVKNTWTIEEFANHNNIPNMDLIYVGQKILISESENIATEEKTKPEVDTYVVQDGDSLWSIWVDMELWDEYGMAFSEFKDINKNRMIKPDNFDYIEPNQELLIQKQFAASDDETTKKPQQTVHDETNKMNTESEQKIAEKSNSFHETTNALITVKTVEKAENLEEAEKIALDFFTDYKNMLDRIGNRLNALFVFFGKIGDEKNKIVIMGFNDNEGGIIEDIPKKMNTNEIRNKLDNANTDEEIGEA
ncbi:MAG: LysM peptidoglycan-binding domain-containing protein, partial [Candidatus Peribacteraceae bacterium]|nr:LysM peptidoglycan-binding domain-containing protein [Candidatus Peribacteraceae bacterium]